VSRPFVPLVVSFAALPGLPIEFDAPTPFGRDSLSRALPGKAIVTKRGTRRKSVAESTTKSSLPSHGIPIVTFIVAFILFFIGVRLLFAVTRH
jgi:hypothetical protein